MTMGRAHGNQQKHESRNPVQRRLIRRFHDAVVDLVEEVGPASVLEVGCGEGYVLSALVEAGTSAELTGIDLSRDAIDHARERLGSRAELRVEDARDLVGTRERYDVVLMLEVLEHLDDPGAMLPVLGRLAGRAVVLSVPWEPWFRGVNLARLKNVPGLGNDPEHVNHWSRRGFVRFVGTQLTVRDVRSPFPWSLIRADVGSDLP
ncbi:MAG: class I SAM-dependent methyltransferase [Acidimicrobiia bacterium]|nr:class I SAM-dependent methyltransferase [Acidimicrobiia bacterium]